MMLKCDPTLCRRRHRQPLTTGAMDSDVVFDNSAMHPHLLQCLQQRKYANSLQPFFVNGDARSQSYF